MQDQMDVRVYNNNVLLDNNEYIRLTQAQTQEGVF